MLDFLATVWCLVGIIVGLMCLFLVVVGIGAMITEAIKQYGGK